MAPRPIEITCHHCWPDFVNLTVCLIHGDTILDLMLNTMLKSMLVDKNVQIWLMIGWQHSRLQIRTNGKSLFTNMCFKTFFSWIQTQSCVYAQSWITSHTHTHIYIHIYTVETLYNTINFCWSTHKRHSIARPKGRGMGCLLWVQRATYCVDLSLLSSMKYLL